MLFIELRQETLGVTNDFLGYISGTSAVGSWGILWLRTFVKARAAAGAASG